MVQSMPKIAPSRKALQEIHRDTIDLEEGSGPFKEASLSIHCNNWLEGNGRCPAGC